MFTLFPINTLPDRYPYLVQYAIRGALVGLAFPAVAIVFDLIWYGLAPTIWNIIDVHVPVYWMMYAMPVVLGVLAAIPGYRIDLIAIEQNRLSEDLDGLSSSIEEMEKKLQEAITLRDKAKNNLKQAKADRNKSANASTQFLSTMSHEMRTPLNAVIGMSGLLTESGLPKEQLEYARTIKRSGESLLETINNILDYSKLESGTLELHQKEFVLRQVLDEVMTQYGSIANEKGLELVYTVDEQVPARFTGDAIRVKQIVSNLVSNALKFTETGEVVVSIRQKDNGQLELEVHDTGIGISEEQMGRLFRPFIQVEDGSTRQFGGTGLGLAISSRLAEAMGGSISVQSSPGNGATFTSTLRFEPGITRSAPVDTEMLSGRRIFIADAHPASLRALDHLCHGAGMKPVIFSDPASLTEALPAISQFDIGIINQNCCGGDSTDFAARVKAGSGESPLALVLLSQSAGKEGSHTEGLFNQVLPKPVRHLELMKCLVQLVR